MKLYLLDCLICTAPSGPYTAVNWSTVYGKAGTPNVSAIKEALCVHGPVVAAMYTTDAFAQYKDGDSDVNHDILIIGWDDKKDAWLIKNSWGSNWWGQKGFGWIRYRSNNIGYGAAWVDAVKVVKSAAAIPDPKADLQKSADEAKAIGDAAVEQVAKDIAGGPNSVVNNPGQIFGGTNSVLHNPGQILGGPNSVVKKIFEQNKFKF
jgi:Papain family cysteine protease